MARQMQQARPSMYGGIAGGVGSGYGVIGHALGRGLGGSPGPALLARFFSDQ